MQRETVEGGTTLRRNLESSKTLVKQKVERIDENRASEKTVMQGVNPYQVILIKLETPCH